MQAAVGRVVQTSRGMVEYDLTGRGPAVILCHGTGGGVDQGIMLAGLLHGFQGIAISRAGYLRTPLETGSSPSEMADAYAALLDSLNIQKAAILGLSAGGISAAQFALMHPKRCWALVLADAITRAPPLSSRKMVERANALPDAIAWLITRIAIHVGLPILIRDPETRRMMRIFFENNPISARRAGVGNDLSNVNAVHDLPWEDIRVPSLLIHGSLDRLVPVEYSQHVAGRIPHAELLIIDGGGHECLVSHHRQTAPKLNAFLRRHQVY